MKIILKTLKYIGLTLLTIILIAVVGGTIFMHTSPEFGGEATDAQKKEYVKTGHYKLEDEVFFNIETTIMEPPSWDVMKKFMEDDPSKQPAKHIQPERVDSITLAKHDTSFTKLTWFGHSAFLLQMDGKNILLDPMLGESPSPVPAFGATRYSKELPIEVEKLPIIDAMIFSHDHYDHLDYGTIQKLKGRVGKYYVPMGIGNHLRAWGVEDSKIHELNWWDNIDFDGINLILTPSRHFSGRGLADRNATLWGSWVLQGKKDKVYFSGDGGYGKHFKEIGEKYGPFDIALMECGQYNEAWKAIHMMPEETVQAGVDIQAKVLMPIHWGAFTLALHSWTDPIERAVAHGEKLNMPIVTPKIGEAVLITGDNYPQKKWWTGY